MAFQGRPCNTDHLFLFGAAAAGWTMLFPPSAYAVEVGCFCTFVMVSFMATLGTGLTMFSKRLIMIRMWPASWKRIILVTGLEFVLLLVVLSAYQAAFAFTGLTLIFASFLRACARS